MEKMKKVWMRLGVTIWLTEQEIAVIECGGKGIREIIWNKTKNGDLELDGESYIPEHAGDACHHDIPEEIEFTL